MSKKSSNFAPVIKTTQSFLYLKIINRLIPYRKKDAEKRPFSAFNGVRFSGLSRVCANITYNCARVT